MNLCDREQLTQQFQQVNITENARELTCWELEKSKQFMIGSLYRFLTDRGVKDKQSVYILKSRIPSKIKIFMWQLLNGKLQAAQVLKK